MFKFLLIPAMLLAMYSCNDNKAHGIMLSWTKSPTLAVSYKVYRGSKSGGPYVPLAATTGVSYLDQTVQRSQIYYYVATSVKANVESVRSNELKIAVP